MSRDYVFFSSKTDFFFFFFFFKKLFPVNIRVFFLKTSLDRGNIVGLRILFNNQNAKKKKKK